MLKLLHAADFHIGAEFEFLPKPQAEQAKKMQLSQLTALINRANDIGTDAVLLAGDLFDTPAVSSALASEAFSILSKAQCPVLLSPGNHDYYWSRSPYAVLTLPSNLHLFTERTLTPYPLPDGGAVVWGAAFQDIKTTVSLHADLDSNLVNVCLMHGEMNGDSGYNPLTKEAASTSGFDYIALGHNHTFSGVQQAGSCFYACPGCFSPAVITETGEKGYLTGTLSKGDVSLAFQPSRSIEFAEILLPMDRITTDEQLEAELKKSIPDHHSRVCCTLRLTGQRQYEPDLKALRLALEQVFFASFLRDETREPTDLWQYLDDGGLRGQVSCDFKARITASKTEEEHEKLLLALKYALWALDGQTPNL